MIVIIGGKKQDMTYEDICKKLGFIAETGFVKVTPQGNISFTAGKSNEVQALFRAALDSGMQLSTKAKRIARQNRWFAFLD